MNEGNDMAIIDRPIFIIGMPRSGTSVFYEKLALNSGLACLTQNSRKFPRSVLLSRLNALIRRNPKPTEAPQVWMRAARREDDTLTRADATPALCRYYRDVVGTQLRLAGKTRFLGKYPRNGLRMEFLDAIFPGCLFLHVIRDGRDVLRSILEKREAHGGRNRYWGIRPPGWRGLSGCEPVEAIGLQYNWSIAYMLEHAAPFRPDRYKEVRFEDFCADPKAVLRQVGDFCGLEWQSAELDKSVEGVWTSNGKWQEQFNAEERATLERVIGPMLCELGYKA
jgi:hypothetical protein